MPAPPETQDSITTGQAFALQLRLCTALLTSPLIIFSGPLGREIGDRAVAAATN